MTTVACCICGRRGSAATSGIPIGWLGSLSGVHGAFSCSERCYWDDAKKHAPELAERIGMRLGMISKGKGKKAAASDEYRYSGPLFEEYGDD